MDSVTKVASSRVVYLVFVAVAVQSELVSVFPGTGSGVKVVYTVVVSPVDVTVTVSPAAPLSIE